MPNGRGRSAPLPIPPDAGGMLAEARVGRLATADAEGRPHVVPICFVLDGRNLYSAIDEKPKRAAPRRLRRVRNIEANPQVALVVDHYEEDWRRLRFVLISGTARVIAAGQEHARAVALLRQKYPQYRAMRLEERPVIKISPRRVAAWAASDSE
ncbi:MAG TPA: TIGR03668 family PPOX class F420-dependent oxidoreductase [bacterium]|nr:TIGR03668 family PPOX class F420-dependent oxidoreductase [bacterium]